MRNLARRPEVDAAGAGAHQAAVGHVCRARLQRELDLRRRSGPASPAAAARPPPLTIGAAMLVPLSCMYALVPLPARCRDG